MLKALFAVLLVLLTIIAVLLALIYLLVAFFRLGCSGIIYLLVAVYIAFLIFWASANVDVWWGWASSTIGGWWGWASSTIGGWRGWASSTIGGWWGWANSTIGGWWGWAGRWFQWTNWKPLLAIFGLPMGLSIYFLKVLLLPKLSYIHRRFDRLLSRAFMEYYPFMEFRFPEFSVDQFNGGWMQNAAYTQIEAYLSSKYFGKASILTFHNNSYTIVFKEDDCGIIDEHTTFIEDDDGIIHGKKVKVWWNLKSTSQQQMLLENNRSTNKFLEIVGTYEGAKVLWNLVSQKQDFSYYPTPDAQRYYQLMFYRCNRRDIENTYIDCILNFRQRPHPSPTQLSSPPPTQLSKPLKLEQRTQQQTLKPQIEQQTLKLEQRRLYTNNPSQAWYDYKGKVWSHVVFRDVSTFDTIAMDPIRKREIMNELTQFKAAMDAKKEEEEKIKKEEEEEKEEIKEEAVVWKLGYLIHGPSGTGKSTLIAAIANFLDYDIYDLELSTVESNLELQKLFVETLPKSIIVIEDVDSMKSNSMQISELLNIIDGLKSVCVREQVIILTAIDLDKLDTKLILRIDRHIEMSYCSFHMFKVLINNYWNIEVHELFDKVQDLLKKVNFTPAEVSEHLIRKSPHDVSIYLKSLIEALEASYESKRPLFEALEASYKSQRPKRLFVASFKNKRRKLE